MSAVLHKEEVKADTSKPKIAMEYRLLGNTGLKVSVLSYGSFGWFTKDIDKVMALMETAISHGVNFFDCAEGYSGGECERAVGEAIKRKGWKRSDLVISTKIFWGGSGPNDMGCSRKHIIEGTLASLKRLQMDYVDLLFCHRPDPQTPIEETVRAMNYLIDQGKAFYWGTSEWSATQIESAIGIAKDLKLIPPQFEQPEYNMFQREKIEKEFLDLFKFHKYGSTIWSPLGSGALTGKYNKGIPKGSIFDDPSIAHVPWVRKVRNGGPAFEAFVSQLNKIEGVAKELGTTLPLLALAWCIRNPNVSTVISGSHNPAQIDDAVTALTLVPKLTAEVLAKIDAILENKPTLPGFFGR